MECLDKNLKLPPDLSIIIPLYNDEKNINKALDAIFNNTFKNFEVIIIDDGSTDNSVENIKFYPVKIFRQQNFGPAKARNLGVKKANGNIIVFIDSDIIMPAFALQKIHETFANHQDINILGGMPDAINHYHNIISDYENLYIHYQFYRQKNTTTAFYTSLVAIKKDIFNKYNGFNEQIRMPEDMELGQRLLSGGYIIYLDKNIKFSHLKNFTCISYIKKQIKKTAGILKIKLRNIKSRAANHKCYDVSIWFQLGIPASLLIPLCLVLAIFIKSLTPIYFAIIIFVGLIFINRKMLIYMYHNRSITFVLAASLILLINYWVYAIGLGYGLAFFILGKKY